ncbi:MAG: 30S ribosomal protein S14 [Bdellovibrionaceae bacterium]|nr:30S ribosomal protein S14 [Pseudobdellovibrionaceae bacterium]MDW8190891.1 30S ribosomal protein S14 [Pseudobdellovibrionaceae bacterium]
MARLASIKKNELKKRLIEKKKARRDELRAKMKDLKIPVEEKLAIQFELQKLGRRSCPTQYRNRCYLSGRPRGYLRDFALCRNMFRKLASEGKLPGVIKASW